MRLHQAVTAPHKHKQELPLEEAVKGFGNPALRGLTKCALGSACSATLRTKLINDPL